MKHTILNFLINTFIKENRQSYLEYLKDHLGYTEVAFNFNTKIFIELFMSIFLIITFYKYKLWLTRDLIKYINVCSFAYTN